MPGFVKTARDEEIWQESKRKVEKSKGKKEGGFTDQDWGLVNQIFHAAKKKYKGKSLPKKYHASYLVRANWKDHLPGGKADRKDPSDFDPESIKEGVKVEMEHTSDRNLATEIAMDHLTEDPMYYKKLAKIHKD